MAGTRWSFPEGNFECKFETLNAFLYECQFEELGKQNKLRNILWNFPNKIKD